MAPSFVFLNFFCHAVGSFRMALRLNRVHHKPLENRWLSLLNMGLIGCLSCGLVGSCANSCFHPFPGSAAHTCLTPVQEGQPVLYTQPRSRVLEKFASRAVRTSVTALFLDLLIYCARRKYHGRVQGFLGKEKILKWMWC